MAYSLSHLSDAVLLRDLSKLASQDRSRLAHMLAHVAEVEVRKLYVSAAHASMHSYCVRALGWTPETAFKRIRAARVARKFPRVFDAIADGRLHVSGVIMLATHLTPENGDHLLAAAESKSKTEIEQLLVSRFPKAAVPTVLEAVRASSAPLQLSPGTVQCWSPPSDTARRPKVTALATDRFSLQLTMTKSTHDKLRRAQQLLGHRIPSGDIPAILDRALDALIRQLEKRKFAATDKPRAPRRRRVENARFIPAHVKRAVHARDAGRCTFVGDSGHRCEARTDLEFDHVVPVARGGEAAVDGIRLRCRTHNQYEAERVFGAEFMKNKREAAQELARARSAIQKIGASPRVESLESTVPGDRCDRSSGPTERAAADGKEPAREAGSGPEFRDAAAQPHDLDVVPWLRRLGYRTDEARRASAYCATLPGDSLEQSVRAALAFLRPAHRLERPMRPFAAASP